MYTVCRKTVCLLDKTLLTTRLIRSIPFHLILLYNQPITSHMVKKKRHETHNQLDRIFVFRFCDAQVLVYLLVIKFHACC
ncbi:hypothetical protein Hanom_Chr10g00962171 [Helianthus anomalus]